MEFTDNSTGKQYTFNGEYRVPRPNDYYLSGNGTIMLWEKGFFQPPAISAIIDYKPKTYDLGGLRFIETGEYRQIMGGEFYVSGVSDKESVELWSPLACLSASKHQVLRPVAILW